MNYELSIQEAGRELARLGIEIGPDDPRSAQEVLASTSRYLGNIANGLEVRVDAITTESYQTTLQPELTEIIT